MLYIIQSYNHPTTPDGHVVILPEEEVNHFLRYCKHPTLLWSGLESELIDFRQTEEDVRPSVKRRSRR